MTAKCPKCGRKPTPAYCFPPDDPLSKGDCVVHVPDSENLS